MNDAPATLDRNAMAAEVLPRAHAFAVGKARGDMAMEERLTDAATDAVVHALNVYQPGKGEWVSFALACVRQWVRTAAGRRAEQCSRRPAVVAFPEGDEPAAPDKRLDSRIMSAELRDLPPDLRDAVRFFYIDRFTLEECGFLLGITAPAVRKRLHRAAKHLHGADDATADAGNRLSRS